MLFIREIVWNDQLTSYRESPTKTSYTECCVEDSAMTTIHSVECSDNIRTFDKHPTLSNRIYNNASTSDDLEVHTCNTGLCT